MGWQSGRAKALVAQGALKRLPPIEGAATPQVQIAASGQAGLRPSFDDRYRSTERIERVAERPTVDASNRGLLNRIFRR